MTKSFEFRQILATTYHCKRCKEDFKCTKKISPKQRKEPSQCNLCENQHIRCEDNKCENCCKKFNKCNNPDNLGHCDHCTELGFECEYTFPRTDEEFKKYSPKYLKGSNENQECEEINQMKLADMKRTDKIIKENISLEKIVENPDEFLPRNWIKNLKDKEYLEKKTIRA
ncbi:23929_t:CDS:2 [Gigaspora margarita]|uniref:23929_t:CDS:1 n=1 Tax=Gigaspora margarita TaxID=4874 RepID=A0ABM8W0M2_GIGMA|nr:23929_t:CDS:2 [Gigaspora margarita]